MESLMSSKRSKSRSRRPMCCLLRRWASTRVCRQTSIWR
jgi:hypothetical protein